MYYRRWNYLHVHVHPVSKSGLDLGMLVRKLKLYKWIIFNLSVFFQNQGSGFLRLICIVPSLFPALHYKAKLMGAEKLGLIFLSGRVRLNMPFSDSLSETTKMCEGKICFSSGQTTCTGAGCSAGVNGHHLLDLNGPFAGETLCFPFKQGRQKQHQTGFPCQESLNFT